MGNTNLAPVLIAILLVPLCYGYTSSKISEYFESYDSNSDGFLERSQYTEQLKAEDLESQINEDYDYYYQLTDLLYEKYDTNNDGKFDRDQWMFFGSDIVDQGVNGLYGYSIQEEDKGEL